MDLFKEQTNYLIQRTLSATRFPVYKGTDIITAKEAAIKCYPQSWEVCQNEIQIMSRLNHQNIIKPVKMMFIQDTAILSFEYAQHGDLFELVKRNGAMPEILARTIFSKMLDAISHMHSRNVAHLDIKLENILLDETFCVKLTDFDMSQSLTDTKLIGFGTPGYRAPEVKDGTCDNFAAADIYSLGVMLFTLLSGNSPYGEKKTEDGFEFDQFYRLFRKDNNKYWAIQSKYSENGFNKEAINLINSMLSEDPRSRPTIREIRDHKWFKLETLKQNDYVHTIRDFLKM